MESPAPGARCPVQEQRARWERKRACTARELLETERRYQEQLGLVATYFVAILRAKGTLRPPERQALFGPWELIYGASQELLPYLEGGRWGQGLEGFCNHLELYTQFAANVERSRTILQEQLKKNKHFRRFVRLQEGRPEFGGLQLQDLLPLPLQRLQQYENLAVALAENTGPNSPEHKQLTRAAQLISETAQRVHTISQKQKNEQHLQRIQALLSGRQAKGLISVLKLYQNNGSPTSQVAGSYARDGYWWCLPEGSLGPECSSFSLMHSSWPSLDPHCICCRVAPLPAGPSTPWASVNSTGSLATQEALVVDCLACPFPMRSYCLCPQTRRSCHTGTTV
ncbi:rho guanine nucleotide exchange factor 39 isoform X3 [Bubalus bubalis]|uniref:rho guanine nucleotide exchange factor 39 isoform X3 n=1 Tax=Bubalus bubalis TaxID=89462 RepID=UPI00042CB402|nr:rho guanine nucleotide exchange factor 39 isoform X3 [Bubalus bubalis]